MSLGKKDVRAWLSHEAHEVLKACADLHEKEIGEYASFLLERTLLGEGHAAKLFIQRIARLGKSRSRSESVGSSEKPRKG